MTLKYKWDEKQAVRINPLNFFEFFHNVSILKLFEKYFSLQIYRIISKLVFITTFIFYK